MPDDVVQVVQKRAVFGQAQAVMDHRMDLRLRLEISDAEILLADTKGSVRLAIAR